MLVDIEEKTLEKEYCNKKKKLLNQNSRINKEDLEKEISFLLKQIEDLKNSMPEEWFYKTTKYVFLRERLFLYEKLLNCFYERENEEQSK